MRSIRELVHEEGLSGVVGLRSLCTRYSVSSLTDLISAHDAHERAAAAHTFHQTIETPSGIPLGGSIDLEIHGNGDYNIAFHMHSCSITGDFDFDLRAYLTAPNCPVFFFHHSGHVSGVDSADYPESGNMPFIALYWSQLQSGAAFTAGHDYQWGGVVGTLDRLANDLVSLRILDFGAGVAGTALGVVIGTTREATGWLNTNLGAGGTIGLLSGVAVFAAAEALGVATASAAVFATVVGVAAGALTDALISSRPLQPDEIDRARLVFGESIPYDKVTLTNLAGLGNRAFTAPGVDGRIYCNLGPVYANPLGPYGGAYPANGQALIHELTHAWQIAHGAFLPGFVCSGVVNQADFTFGDDVYLYGAAGQGWSNFNLEQQAAIVDQWYAGNLDQALNDPQSDYRPMDTDVKPDGSGYNNPYYVYIHDNIRR